MDWTSGSLPEHRQLQIVRAIGFCAAAVMSVGGCGAGLTPPASTEKDLIASVINVTNFEVSVLISGILGEAVDTVERTIGPSDSTDVVFTCLDELVVGDPLDPTQPGITIHTEDEPTTIEPFSLLAGEAFLCGDIIEIIVSGNDADSFAVDVFALTPPG